VQRRAEVLGDHDRAAPLALELLMQPVGDLLGKAFLQLRTHRRYIEDPSGCL
jgi:hypothetical protein